MSIYEMYELLIERHDHVICIDKETGERFNEPCELPVDIAGKHSREARFLKNE